MGLREEDLELVNLRKEEEEEEKFNSMVSWWFKNGGFGVMREGDMANGEEVCFIANFYCFSHFFSPLSLVFSSQLGHKQRERKPVSAKTFIGKFSTFCLFFFFGLLTRFCSSQRTEEKRKQIICCR